MNPHTPQINWLVFWAITLIAAFALGYWLISVDAFEFVYYYTRSHEDWELDEIIVVVIALLIAHGFMAMFALVFLSHKITRYAMVKQAKLHEDFYVTQNLKAMGTMLAGIAHSINNLMQPILTCSDYLIKTTDKNADTYRDLDIIHSAAMQAHTLSHDILHVSRHTDAADEVVALTKVVEGISSILKAAVPAHITFETDLSPCGSVKIPIQHVQTVILNLVHNSIDAIGDTGQITITTRQTRAEHPNEFLGLPRMWAVLEIADTGEGMDNETRKQIFDPFFTTKEIGKGTGLGLSIAQTVVQDCGGFIKVVSRLGKGTTFILYFPLATPEDEKHA